MNRDAKHPLAGRHESPFPVRSGCRGRSRRGREAFTMIEIALSLAVVAFALVAILGVLPAGLQVQKDNREETLVNADGTYILEAIRHGHDRLGLLSNAVYLVSINYYNGDRVIIPNDPPVLDSRRLVGLLSTPASPTGVGVSNVVAWVRAINSPAIDLDPNAREVAFRYQMVSEIRPFLGYPPALTNRLSTNDLARIWRLQENLHEVRLTMRWPLFSDAVSAPQNARVGTHRRTFRQLVAGGQYFYPTNVAGQEQLLYSFRPSVY